MNPLNFDMYTSEDFAACEIPDISLNAVTTHNHNFVGAGPNLGPSG